MARYVLLSFDDTKEAEAFIVAVGEGAGGSGGVIYAHSPDPVEGTWSYAPFGPGVFVRGLYMKPTAFCTCHADGTWQKQDGYTRGKKFGLYVHNRCGKPSKAWAAGDAWYTALGKNLLPMSEKAPEWRGEGVPHHKWDPEKKAWIHVESGEPYDPKKALSQLSGLPF